MIYASIMPFWINWASVQLAARYASYVMPPAAGVITCAGGALGAAGAAGAGGTGTPSANAGLGVTATGEGAAGGGAYAAGVGAWVAIPAGGVSDAPAGSGP